MAKMDTQFMTKAAEKPYPLGAAHTYIAHIREYPPPGNRTRKRIQFVLNVYPVFSSSATEEIKIPNCLIILWEEKNKLTTLSLPDKPVS